MTSNSRWEGRPGSIPMDAFPGVSYNQLRNIHFWGDMQKALFNYVVDKDLITMTTMWIVASYGLFLRKEKKNPYCILKNASD